MVSIDERSRVYESAATPVLRAHTTMFVGNGETPPGGVETLFGRVPHVRTPGAESYTV